MEDKSWLHSGDIGSVDKDGKRERKESERVKYCSIKWCTIPYSTNILCWAINFVDLSNF